MKKLLVDTNIILDLLAKRAPHFPYAAQLFSRADLGEIQLTTIALSIVNANYILAKQVSKSKALETVRKLRILVDVLPLEEKIIDLALNDPKFKDFEDALQFYSAVENKQEVIITRNLKDFKSSTIPVLTAKQFMASRR